MSNTDQTREGFVEAVLGIFHPPTSHSKQESQDSRDSADLSAESVAPKTPVSGDMPPGLEYWANLPFLKSDPYSDIKDVPPSKEDYDHGYLTACKMHQAGIDIWSRAQVPAIYNEADALILNTGQSIPRREAAGFEAYGDDNGPRPLSMKDFRGMSWHAIEGERGEDLLAAIAEMPWFEAQWTARGAPLSIEFSIPLKDLVEAHAVLRNERA